jgi:hypothetical protein
MTATENEGALAGLQGGAMVPVEDAALVGASAREFAEVQAALAIADARPRNERQAYQNLMRSMERPGMAMEASYTFPRGGKSVSGASVCLAREAARLWGNLRYSLKIVSSDDDQIHIEGVAWDLQTNTRITMEDRFKPLIQRKMKNGKTQWVSPDERDLRELTNRRGAICVRNALLQLIPSDIIEDARIQGRRTVERAAKGGLQDDKERTIRDLIASFGQVRVSIEQLEEFLGQPVEHITAQQLADLREIRASIKDGNSKVGDHFVFAPKKGPEAGGDRATINKEDMRAKPEPEVTVTPEGPADQGPGPEHVGIYEAIEQATTLKSLDRFTRDINRDWGEKLLSTEERAKLLALIQQREEDIRRKKGR